MHSYMVAFLVQLNKQANFKMSENHQNYRLF